MDLRQVEYFLAIIDYGGFTRAATALHVAQPSLSQRIRNLETDLGTPLFHRLGRKVVLTAAGEAFHPAARKIVEDVGAAREAVEAVIGLTGGGLDLVALASLAVEPLAPLISAYHDKHPNVPVRLLQPVGADAVFQLVRNGTCELGFAELPQDHDLEAIELLDQEILAVCPPGTALDQEGVVDAAQLSTMPLITTPSGTSSRRLIEAALGVDVVQHAIAVETDHREAMLPLVLAGAGTMFLPASSTAQATSRGAVVAHISPAVHRRIGIVHRSGPLSPAASAFAALAVAMISARPPDAPTAEVVRTGGPP